MTFADCYITITLRLNRNHNLRYFFYLIIAVKPQYIERKGEGKIMRVTFKAARINRNLTQPELAKALGVGVRTIQNWESGASSPRADMMPEICKVLACETNDIIFLPRNCG